jgi:hypothetical protein
VTPSDLDGRSGTVGLRLQERFRSPWERQGARSGTGSQTAHRSCPATARPKPRPCVLHGDGIAVNSAEP